MGHSRSRSQRGTKSTGHIIATTRHSNQQRSKSRQNPRQVQPTGALETCRRQDDVFGYELQLVSTAVSGVLPVFQDLSYKLLQQRKLSHVLRINGIIKKATQKVFRPIVDLHDNTLCDALLGMSTTINCQTTYQTSLLYIVRNPERLLLLSSNDGQRFP